MDEVDIILERETANDEFASVVKVHVASGALVTQGQLLFEIENSKAVQEIEAPIDGAVVHALTLNDEVGLGQPIARIVPLERVAQTVAPDARRAGAAFQAETIAAPTTSGPPPVRVARQVTLGGGRGVAAPRPANRAPILSKAAARLIGELGIDPEIFQAEFITAADVLAQAGGERHAAELSTPAVPSGGAAQAGATPVTSRKRAEIQSLQSGAGATMLSVLGVTLGPVAVARAGAPATDSGITDLVLYEASRLMRKYPNLNAAYADGAVRQHATVNGGMAIDTGGRLVVYGIENSDTLDLVTMRETIDQAVARYLDGGLTATEMTRATFSVTDLSGEALDFVLPLLPAGQSCIVGVTRDGQGSYRLFAGFDHRVTEGREVGQFLGELSTRIRSFGGRAPGAVHSCFYCERSALDEVRDFNGKGLLRLVNAEGDDVLCCRACFDGW